MNANYSEYTLADLDGDGNKDIFLIRFDAEQARSLGLPVLAAPGLPGVYAPYTAAELMRETIYTVISEGDE